MSSALRRLARPKPVVPASDDPAFQRCEMCTVPIDEHRHSHVVHLEKRSLLCTCRPCALLFTERGAAQGRYRAVPDRYLRDPAFTMSEVQWDQLQIPVRMAFFFHNSEMERPLAFYPSPAGATESLLPMDAWREGLGGSALAAEMEFDVEALLLRKVGTERSASGTSTDTERSASGTSIDTERSASGTRIDTERSASGTRIGSETECLLVPIDVCYELVGLVRTHWKGFDGGTEAWERIDGFFADLATRARDLTATSGAGG
jgi:hypothetical protein